MEDIDVTVGEIYNTQIPLKVSGNWRNTTNQTLLVDRIQTSCNCTQYNVREKTIEPGNELVIDFEIDLASRRGAFGMSAVVQFTSKDVKALCFKIQGEANQVARFTPNTLALAPNNGEGRTLKVYLSEGKDRWQIFNVYQNQKWFDYKLLNVERSRGATSTILTYEITAKTAESSQPEAAELIFQFGCPDDVHKRIDLKIPVTR